jgi:hypothetical protein
MNVLWVAQDNKKNGSFIQRKAEVLCTLSSLLFIKQFNPEFKTVFYLDDWTKKYYEQFGILELFDVINTQVLNKLYPINYDYFFTASKLIALRDIEGPTLNLDLDFFIYCDIKKYGIFDSDMACLWVELLHDDDVYMKLERALSLVKIPFELPLDECAINVSFLYTKSTFFRQFYSNILINYMIEISRNKTIDEKEWNGLILFVEQYLSHQFAKDLNQKIKVLVDDFYPINSLSDYVDSIGIHHNNSGEYFYHFGTHKKFLIDNKQNEKYCNIFYNLTKEKIFNQEHIKILDNVYNIPLDDRCFKV